MTQLPEMVIEDLMVDILDARYRYEGHEPNMKLSEAGTKAKDEFLIKVAEPGAYEELDCFVCGGHEFYLVSEVDRYGFFYPTGLCAHCGNVQQTSYYNASLLEEFYTHYYRKIYGDPTPAQLFEMQKKGHGPDVLRFVTETCAPQKVLEIGCGAGGILSLFHERGCQVLGLDFDEDYLKFAESKGVAVRRGSLESLAQDEQFDLIILNHVLEHIVDPRAFLTQVSQHLSGDGVLFIGVAALDAVASGAYRCDLLNYWQNAHTIHFTSQTLKMLCERVGFRSVQHVDEIKSCWKHERQPKPPTMAAMRGSMVNSVRLLGQIEGKREIIKKNEKIVLDQAQLVNALSQVKAHYPTLATRLKKLL